MNMPPFPYFTYSFFYKTGKRQQPGATWLKHPAFLLIAIERQDMKAF